MNFLSHRCVTLSADPRFSASLHWAKYVSGSTDHGLLHPAQVQAPAQPNVLTFAPALQVLSMRFTQNALVRRLVTWAAAGSAAGVIARESITAAASWETVEALQQASEHFRRVAEHGAAQWAVQMSTWMTSTLLCAAVNGTPGSPQAGTHAAAHPVLHADLEHVACEGMLLLGVAMELAVRPFLPQGAAWCLHSVSAQLEAYVGMLKRQLQHMGLLQSVHTEAAAGAAGAPPQGEGDETPPPSPYETPPLSPFTAGLAAMQSPALSWNGHFVPLKHRRRALSVLACMLFGDSSETAAEAGITLAQMLDAEPSTTTLPIFGRLPTADEFATVDSCVLHTMLGRRGVMPLPASVLFAFLASCSGIPGVTVVGAPGRVVAGLHGPTAVRQLLAAGAELSSPAVQAYLSPPKGLDSTSDAIQALKWDGSGNGNNIKCSSFIDVFQFCTPRSRGALLYSLRITPTKPDAETPWLVPLSTQGVLTRMCNNLHACISGGGRVRWTDVAGPVLLAFAESGAAAGRRCRPALHIPALLEPAATIHSAAGGADSGDAALQMDGMSSRSATGSASAPVFQVQHSTAITASQRSIGNLLQGMLPGGVADGIRQELLVVLRACRPAPVGVDHIVPFPLLLAAERVPLVSGGPPIAGSDGASFAAGMQGHTWITENNLMGDDEGMYSDSANRPPLTPLPRQVVGSLGGELTFRGGVGRDSHMTAELCALNLAHMATAQATSLVYTLGGGAEQASSTPLAPPAPLGGSAPTRNGSSPEAFRGAVRQCVSGAVSACSQPAQVPAAHDAVQSLCGLLATAKRHYLSETNRSLAAVAAATGKHSSDVLQDGTPSGSFDLEQDSVVFSAGMVVLHRRHGYIGVITGGDPRCLAPPRWQRQMGVSPDVASKPFYHVLVDARTFQEHEATTYVAECNIQVLPPLALLRAAHLAVCSETDAAVRSRPNAAVDHCVRAAVESVPALSAVCGLPQRTLLHHVASILEACGHLCLGFKCNVEACPGDAQPVADALADSFAAAAAALQASLPSASVVQPPASSTANKGVAAAATCADSEPSALLATTAMCKAIQAAPSFGYVPKIGTILEIVASPPPDASAGRVWHHSQLQEGMLLGGGGLFERGSVGMDVQRLLLLPRPSQLWDDVSALRKLVARACILVVMGAALEE